MTESKENSIQTFIPKNMSQPGKLELLGHFYGYRNIFEGVVWLIPWAVFAFTLFSGYTGTGVLGFLFLVRGTEDGDSLLSALNTHMKFEKQARNYAQPTLEDLEAYRIAHPETEKQASDGKEGYSHAGDAGDSDKTDR